MKNMRLICTLLIASSFFIGCSTSPDQNEEIDPAIAAFEKNSALVLQYLDAWQAENVDYEKFYANDYAAWGTGFGDLDTMNLAQVMEWDKMMFATYDFKITNVPVNLLPGVDVETKKMDGSVRHYSEWEITLTATDSTEARTANLRMYHAIVFNDEGKITLDLAYGDFGGLMGYLHGQD